MKTLPNHIDLTFTGASVQQIPPNANRVAMWFPPHLNANYTIRFDRSPAAATDGLRIVNAGVSGYHLILTKEQIGDAIKQGFFVRSDGAMDIDAVEFIEQP
jgi:hypothetical protein